MFKNVKIALCGDFIGGKIAHSSSEGLLEFAVVERYAHPGEKRINVSIEATYLHRNRTKDFKITETVDEVTEEILIDMAKRLRPAITNFTLHLDDEHRKSELAARWNQYQVSRI